MANKQAAIMITIADMRTLARRRGGKCLSEKYINTDTNLVWQCAKGHIWKNRPAKIKKGQWCRICAGTAPKSLEFLQSLATKKNGKCLSTVYPGMHGYAKWRCSHGHEWNARPANVRSGTWCPHCAGKHQSIKDMRSLAKLRGGDCLSHEYRTQSSKLQWQCKQGHEWGATPNSIKNGSWCPHCHVNFGEEICRLYFEGMFKKAFPKVRPEFLKDGRSALELDGFCEELNLAFEHHGRQHYRTIKQFHQNGQSHRAQRSRDKKKRKISRSRGIAIVEIPEVPALISLAHLPTFIDAELGKLGIAPKVPATSIKIDVNRIYRLSTLERLQQIAKKNGGSLLSKRFLGDRGHLEWRCRQGHEWSAKPNSILSGSWCPHCYGNVRKSITDIETLATERGLRLLSTEYSGTHGKLKWRCSKGHEWEATPNKIRSAASANGCPRCTGQVKTLDDMNAIASRHGGRCISKVFLGMHRYLEWKCKEGHRFNATPNIAHQQKGVWCPECRKTSLQLEIAIENRTRFSQMMKKQRGVLVSGEIFTGASRVRVRCKMDHEWETRVSQIQKGAWCLRCASAASALKTRLGIPAMREIARKRGGDCLSTEYVNQDTKLRFVCNKRHEWEAAPNNIKAGKWCPFCAGKRKTAADMHELARKRGFKFLSSDYFGDAKHHKWECAQGHKWQAWPSNIIQGRGCPVCARSNRSRNRIK